MSAAPPGVAVVIPAFNAAETLAAALASIAGQRVQPAEVVVVDDGSRDETVAIARHWAAMLPLRVVERPTNAGPGQARNEGVRSTSAPMIAFLDADDVWFPNHLTTCLELQARTGGVVSGRGLRWHEQRGIIPGQGEDGDVGPPVDGALEWLIRHHTFGMHAVMPRSIFEQVGGFDPAMEAVEDWDLWIRIAEAGCPMHRTETRTFLYRQHESNLSLQVDRIGDACVRVHERVVRNHRPLSKGLRSAIRDSGALVAFSRASVRLDTGDFRGARRYAVRALRGPTSISLRAIAIVTAPRLYERLRGPHRSIRSSSGSANTPPERRPEAHDV